MHEFTTEELQRIENEGPFPADPFIRPGLCLATITAVSPDRRSGRAVAVSTCGPSSEFYFNLDAHRGVVWLERQLTLDSVWSAPQLVPATHQLILARVVRLTRGAAAAAWTFYREYASKQCQLLRKFRSPTLLCPK